MTRRHRQAPQARHHLAGDASAWLAWLLLVPLSSLASPGDPLKISANTISVHQGKGTMHYRGSVQVRQESLSIKGTSAVASKTPAGGNHVIVRGKPVRAEAKNPGSQTITIEANQLSYDSIARTLIASGNIRINTPHDLITGSRVRYQLESGQLLLSGDDPGEGITALLTIDSSGNRDTGNGQ